MKELSIEQKAQRYDEVIERAKTEKEKSRNLGLLEFIDENFPELNESGDERIKKCIRMCLTDANEQRFKDYDTNLKDCLVWLEKQGEQKQWKPTEAQLASLEIACDRNDKVGFDLMQLYKELNNYLKELNEL